MGLFLVVDDHPMFREALQSALQHAYPESTILEASTIQSTLQLVEENGSSIDLALLDLSMPDVSGFEGLLNIRACNPKLPIAIVSGMEESHIIAEALSYGVAGFIPKSTSTKELIAAIQEIMLGNVYIPSNYNEPVEASNHAEFIARLQSLTPQQVRVLRMLQKGMLNKQIGFELTIGETTVKAHVSEVLRKLGVYSRTQAVIEVNKIGFNALVDATKAN